MQTRHPKASRRSLPPPRAPRSMTFDYSGLCCRHPPLFSWQGTTVRAPDAIDPSPRQDRSHHIPREIRRTDRSASPRRSHSTSLSTHRFVATSSHRATVPGMEACRSQFQTAQPPPSRRAESGKNLHRPPIRHPASCRSAPPDCSKNAPEPQLIREISHTSAHPWRQSRHYIHAMLIRCHLNTKIGYFQFCSDNTTRAQVSILMHDEPPQEPPLFRTLSSDC